MVDADSRELKYYGFLTVAFENGQLRVFGTDWKPDEGFAHHFESKQSRFADGKVQYWYEQGENAEMRGYTEIFFFPRKNLARRLSGEFLDASHRHRFFARRINEAHDEASERQKIDHAAKAFWASIEPKLKTVVDRPISADWE